MHWRISSSPARWRTTSSEAYEPSLATEASAASSSRADAGGPAGCAVAQPASARLPATMPATNMAFRAGRMVDTTFDPVGLRSSRAPSAPPVRRDVVVPAVERVGDPVAAQVGDVRTPRDPQGRAAVTGEVIDVDVTVVAIVLDAGRTVVPGAVGARGLRP